MHYVDHFWHLTLFCFFTRLACTNAANRSEWSFGLTLFSLRTFRNNAGAWFAADIDGQSVTPRSRCNPSINLHRDHWPNRSWSVATPLSRVPSNRLTVHGTWYIFAWYSVVCGKHAVEWSLVNEGGRSNHITFLYMAFPVICAQTTRKFGGPQYLEFFHAPYRAPGLLFLYLVTWSAFDLSYVGLFDNFLPTVRSSFGYNLSSLSIGNAYAVVKWYVVTGMYRLSIVTATVWPQF